MTYPFPQGKDLLSGEVVSQNGAMDLPAWGVAVIEEVTVPASDSR
jgi:hypothetical protein